jgi:hypothetical protein
LAAAFLAAGFLAAGLRWADDLRRADEEREVIWFKPMECVLRRKRADEDGMPTFKRALIGFGESAPIRDR